jgi:hypothetical protein
VSLSAIPQSIDQGLHCVAVERLSNPIQKCVDERWTSRTPVRGIKRGHFPPGRSTVRCGVSDRRTGERRLASVEVIGRGDLRGNVVSQTVITTCQISGSPRTPPKMDRADHDA